MPASGVLASLRDSTYGTEYDSPLRSLRPCTRSGASRRAGAGRVRTAAFLNALWVSSRAIHACLPRAFKMLKQFFNSGLGSEAVDTSASDPRFPFWVV
jgi:hypothetical protein